jgi:hypothetical protein
LSQLLLGSGSVSDGAKERRFHAKAQRREESTQGEEALNLFAVSFASLRLCVRFLPDKDGPQLQTEPLPAFDILSC